MRIGNLTITDRAVLAPMAGVTDSVFRRLCRRFGAAIVYSEFLSSDGLVLRSMKQEHKLPLAADEHPVAYQLFGARIETFRSAAQLLAAYKPDLIDLNFGCPARKVVGKNGGAAILKDLGLLERIVRETAGAVSLPVTVKMRAGWDRATLVYKEAAQCAVDAGAQAITLHARTRADGAWGLQYAGSADWSYIADLRRSLPSQLPVIGNGDVDSPEAARRMLEQTGCDAVMVGRAALGRPWIFAEINHYLKTGARLPSPSIAGRLSVAWYHLHEKVKRAPVPALAVRAMRQQMAAYIRHWPDTHQLKVKLMTLDTLSEIRDLFTGYLQSHADFPGCAAEDWLGDYLPALDRDWMMHPATTVVC